MGEAGTSPAPHAGDPPFRSIGELAELCGHYCWVERRLFELSGSRASGPVPGEPEPGDPEVRVVLSEMSARHGFLAAQWRDRLPVRAGVDADALVVPPAGPAREALDLIESEPHLLLVLGGLAGQFLPRLMDSYARHLAQASPVSEGPVRAVLECAALSTGREIVRARLVVPGGGRAESAVDSSPLVQRLLGPGSGIFPAARAS
jgi:hypothetical protein